MNHEELSKIIDRRFSQVEAKLDTLDHKLDVYSEQTVQNKQDINWVKGYIKVSISMLIALVSAVAAGLISLVTGK